MTLVPGGDQEFVFVPGCKVECELVDDEWCYLDLVTQPSHSSTPPKEHTSSTNKSTSHKEVLSVEEGTLLFIEEYYDERPDVEGNITRKKSNETYFKERQSLGDEIKEGENRYGIESEKQHQSQNNKATRTSNAQDDDETELLAEKNYEFELDDDEDPWDYEEAIKPWECDGFDQINDTTVFAFGSRKKIRVKGTRQRKQVEVKKDLDGRKGAAVCGMKTRTLMSNCQNYEQITRDCGKGKGKKSKAKAPKHLGHIPSGPARFRSDNSLANINWLRHKEY